MIYVLKSCPTAIFGTWMMFLQSFIIAVQIPPSVTYVPPMKRPIEEEASDEKNQNKKKKKLQKKCKCHAIFLFSLFIDLYVPVRVINLLFAPCSSRREG